MEPAKLREERSYELQLSRPENYRRRTKLSVKYSQGLLALALLHNLRRKKFLERLGDLALL